MLCNGFKKVLAVVGVGVFILGIFSGCGLMPKEDETLAPPLVQPKRTEYELYKTERKDITRFLKGSAALVAETEESLYFTKAGGYIKKIFAISGNSVKKGDILISQDSEHLESQIKMQQNTLKKAQIQYESLKNQYEMYQKIEKQYQPTPKEMEDMNTNLRLQEIDLRSMQIALDDMQKDYNMSIITAPFDGIITFVEDIKKGDTIEAYKTLVTVSNPKKLQLYYKSDEDKNVQDVKTGMKAKITCGDKELEGEVIMAPDNLPKDAKKKYENAVLIRVDGLPENLKWGDYLAFTIDIQTKKNVIAIPPKGLRGYLGNNKFVYILDGESKKEIDVEVGMETPFDIEILSGLKEGDTVILN